MWTPVFRKKRHVIKESRASGDSEGAPDALGSLAIAVSLDMVNAGLAPVPKGNRIASLFMNWQENHQQTIAYRATAGCCLRRFLSETD
jgi:hypothetical protein